MRWLWDRKKENFCRILVAFGLHLGSILVILDLKTDVFFCPAFARPKGGHGIGFGSALDRLWAGRWPLDGLWIGFGSALDRLWARQGPPKGRSIPRLGYTGIGPAEWRGRLALP